MADPKNPFDFGTGSIDKDQWLKDIDNELEGFVSQYANAANKHRTTLLRLAFQDLRNRIASGDMLSRTADGLYQFGSALISGDKHMQEAYQRALGFMGNLARRQINTLAPEPEKKSVGNIEERWIKSLNPSGTYNKTAYWKNQTDEDRKTNLINFLNGELTKVKNHEYNDYGGFTDETTLTNRLNSVLTALNSGKANDWTLQLLGFTKNWLQQPEEEKEEEAPKTRLEQAQENYQAALADLQATLIEQLTAALSAPSPVTKSVFLDDPNKFWNYMSYKRLEQNRINNLKYIDENGNVFLKAGVGFNYVPMGNGVTTYTKTTRNTAWNGQAANAARTQVADLYNSEYNKELDSYFKNLGISYESLRDKKFTNPLMTNLAKLFTYKASQDGDQYVAVNTIKKYFTLLENGTYGLKGTNFSYDPTQGIIYQTSNIDNYKEGGVIKALQGYVFDDSEYVNTPKLNKSQTSSEQPNSSFSNSENARIAATIADIASMGAAFVPGYGTAASAVLGLGSTATNFGADLADGQGLWNATKNAGFGLAADVMGLIPGLGGVGKGAKIARNLMWAVPKMLLWANTIQGIQNAGEIKKSITKLAAPSSMTVLDWLNVSQALQIMTGHGRSVATKVKKAGMSKTTTTTNPEYYVFTNKGKQKVSDETFKKLREVRGTKARQSLTEELMGQGVELQQTRFAPWNTSTKFGAFKEVPGRTTIEVLNKHKGWFSDENLVEKAENINPSVDIRSILNKVNPYKAYYNKRNLPVMPLRNYSSFEARMNGEASPLDIRGPKQPYPTEKPQAPKAEAPKATSKPHNKKKHKKHEIGGVLKALRNGGIIKALLGLNGIYKTNGTEDIDIVTNASNEVLSTPQWGSEQFEFNGLLVPEVSLVSAPLSGLAFIPDWYMQRFNNSQTIKNFPNLNKHTTDLKERLTGTNLNYAYFMNDAYARSGQENKQSDILSYFNNSPGLGATNLEELIAFYNKDIDTLYSPFKNGGFDYTRDDATNHNNLFKKVYGSRSNKTIGGTTWDIGWDANKGTLKTAGSATHARRPVNYEKTFAEELKSDPEKAKLRVASIKYNNINGQVYVDENGKLQILTDEQKKLLEAPKPNNKGGKPEGKGNVVAEETELGTTFPTKIKNPFDPTLLLNSAKLATSLLGNADIYKNLLAEMPQAPLRDEIDRKLAIVGDLRSIDAARNKLADLRQIQRQLQGSDQQVNFASALEAERVGRDIMDNGLKNDALRLFDTAQKSWNIDNEDVMYNTQVGDANRRAIADRARMMAQIRAAYRNGDWNARKSAIDDTAFWALKKYLTEKDLADAAKKELLGDFDSYITTELYNDKDYAGEWKILQLKVINNTATPEDRQRMEAIKAARLKKLRQDYSNKYYNLYHDPIFGGGVQTMMAKNGGSLEKLKLKARGKDNDRYVSMIKDLRKTSYRRRRR